MEALHVKIEAQRNLLKHFSRMMTAFDAKSIHQKSKGYVHSMLEDLEQSFETFKISHELVCEAIRNQSLREEDVPYFNEDIFYKGHDCYITFKSKLLDTQYELQLPSSPNIHSSTFIANRNESMCAAARLPKIDLPTFTGEYLDWIPYRDMFISLVHTNNALTKVQKYYYLKGSCKGSPLDMVNEYPATDASYELAWNALHQRFHNKRKLVEQTLQRLFAIPPATGTYESVKKLLDATRNCLALLSTLSIDTTTWNAILVYITTQKLDKQTRKEWEQSLNASADVQEMSTMLIFLETTFRTLESVEGEKSSPLSSSVRSVGHKPFRRTTYANTTNIQHNGNCPCCNQRHLLYKCFKFQTLSSSAKRDVLNKSKVCLNCLNTGHTRQQCRLSTRCQICHEPHHTIIHNEYAAGNTFPNNKDYAHEQPNAHGNHAPNSSAVSTNVSSLSTELNYCTNNSNWPPSSGHNHRATNNQNVAMHAAQASCPVLLATIQVTVKSETSSHSLKALVDQGAQASFISEEVSQLLDLPKLKTHINVAGIGNKKLTTVKKYVSLKLVSKYQSEYSIYCNALILPSLTSYKPFKPSNFQLPKGTETLFLADPNFMQADKIDLILGGDVYGELLLPGIKIYENGLLLQETKFGWMISGPTGSPTSTISISANLCSLEQQLRLFWEQEELHEEKASSAEEATCEAFFLNTHQRDITGRYIVHLPFKSMLAGNELPYFQQTDYNALKRLKQLESSFAQRPVFAEQYKQFLSEYENLNHMEKVGVYPKDLPRNCFFFPHHGVLRDISTTTKLRVVFDGGNHKPSQTSLNDELYSGPALQNDLATIITRWRRFAIGFTADLEKMFRQILICDEHQKYQCILWRDFKTNEICIYKLRTVTYGTTSAPYLAIRVLQQLADDEKDNYPKASRVLRADTYVDDVISGADSIEEAEQLQSELRQLLESGGFHLRKWSSSSLQVLQSIPEEDRHKAEVFHLQGQNFVKALGLSWDTITDTFSFNQNFSFADKLTKRSLLSDASKLFDPLGWLAPTTITAKIIFQKLWLSGLDWQDELTTQIRDEWLHYRSSLKQLEQISIPRWIGSKQNSSIEIHGFSDASQVAYAAVIYARVTNDQGGVSTHLIQSKTKVAPLRVVTIPRLELCAAVLLAKLTSKIIGNMDFNIENITYWTDSTTVLSWIRTHSSKWTVYVANRVAHIQRVTKVNDWKYISTRENPADCASRGISPRELQNHTLWWNGPSWINKPSSEWPIKSICLTTNLEERKSSVTAHTTVVQLKSDSYPEITSKYSSFNTLKRVMAYVLRFYSNLKSRTLLSNNRCESGYLKTYELKRAHQTLIKITQIISFNEEIACLKHKQELPRRSRIFQLRPFLDDDGIVRVGGRIANSNLSYQTKYPILLAKQNPLSPLLFSEAHKQTLHGGLQLMQAYVLRRYWILSARNLAKNVQRTCIACFKYKAQSYQQLMGNLPAIRLQPARAFKHSGLDYAGPISIKQSTLRTATTTKAYICLFICMCTKAIHLEAVTSLDTDSFLAAFRRFTSRRGPCTDLYSDCGTTFVGANKELQILYNRSSSSLPEHLADALLNSGTTWHFIPPASPHFGGLWEAGVKSTKYHLRRIMRDQILNYEELCTLLTEIESCLNSRPLCPISTDPSDNNALTPAHFLIGEPTRCVPEENLLDSNINRLTRWKKVAQIKQHFWKRWTSEYMCRLQSRPKWNRIQHNAKVGDLVLLLHERSAPGQWPLARIESVHPGPDGLVRVVTLYCNGKFFKRPISKICLLPINDVQSDR